MINEYAQRIRRQLHKYPEVGFDLRKTLELVKSELDAEGVSYTERFCKSSIVATINPQNAKHCTIGIRADMDALPITEKTDAPYKSTIDGRMHACGHDAHTAILLATVKELNNRKDELRCCVKFLFQAAEEFAPGGGKLMAEDGVTDDIDFLVALHCSPDIPVGEIAVSGGVHCASSRGFYLNFYGKNAHVSKQSEGIDAVAMAVQCYTAIEMMIAKRIPSEEWVAFNVGAIHGGETNNIIPAECALYCTLRTLSDETDSFVTEHIKKICLSAAEEAGGRFEFVPSKYYPSLVDNGEVAAAVHIAATEVVGEQNVREREVSMIGEDFSFLANKKPGCMVRLGTRNEKEGVLSGLHTDTFNIDENALDIGVKLFTQFVYDNMDGIGQK